MFDKKLTEEFPIYAHARSRVTDYWGSSPFIQEMKGFIDADRFGTRKTMEQLMAMSDKGSQNAANMQSKLITNMEHLMKDIDDDVKESMYEVLAEVPLFHLLNENGDFANL